MVKPSIHPKDPVMFGLRLPNFVESCQMSEYQIYTLSSAGDCADDHVSNEKTWLFRLYRGLYYPMHGDFNKPI